MPIAPRARGRRGAGLLPFGRGRLSAAAGGAGAARVHGRDRRRTGRQEDHRQRPAAPGGRRCAKTRFGSVARAIMTTDLVPKDCIRRSQAAPRHGAHRGHDQRLRHDPAAHGHHAGLRAHRRRYSGCPLRRMLRRAVERSYNRLSVDGDTSTNDTLAAAGQLRVRRAARPEGNGRGWRKPSRAFSEESRAASRAMAKARAS
jgi:hypothetical protein